MPHTDSPLVSAPLAALALPIALLLGCTSNVPDTGPGPGPGPVVTGPVDLAVTNPYPPADPQPDLFDPCAQLPPLPAGGIKSLSIKTADGMTRVASVHLPPNYNHRGPVRPVILNLHGFTSNPSQQALFSDMDRIADKQNLIVVYPQGSGAGLDPLSWNGPVCCPPATTRVVDDVAFIRQLIDEVSSKLCVDRRRVYATGMSNGGFMTHRLGCELSDRIAAIAPVAGQLTVPSCAAGRPVPVMHFHGTKDPLVPYLGGKPQILTNFPTDLTFPSVAQSITRWVQHNRCIGTNHRTINLPDAHCEQYDGCAPGGDVVLCTVEGGGHTWPGGWAGVDVILGPTSRHLIASELMIKFFLDHPMP